MTLLTLILTCLNVNAADFKLTSHAISEGRPLNAAQVFNGFGCTGKNESPDLAWSGAPAGTKSFALMVYDPDAPTGSGWWHWTVYNLPGTVTTLAKNASGHLGAGVVEGRTDFGRTGYGGACPPAGDRDHHYVFTVFALKTETLDLPADATAAMLGFVVNQNALGKATLTATYGRPK